ncbi:hypothetical protein RUND412_009025 [Rhizina undulata]
MRSTVFFSLFLQFFFVALGFAASVPKDVSGTGYGKHDGNLPQGPLNANETSRAFPLPAPGIKLDMRVVIDISFPIDVGVGPYGDRRWIGFTGGRWKATWGSGTIKSGGEDCQLALKDLTGHVDTRYLLVTDDANPAFIYISTTGWRTGPPDVLKKLSNPATADSVKPTEYASRLYINMETGDPRYSFLNTAMWLGSSSRRSSTVIFDAYRIS